MSRVYRGLQKDPTPEEILEHAKLRRQVMDLFDFTKHHARMERDRKAYEKEVKERAKQGKEELQRLFGGKK